MSTVSSLLPVSPALDQIGTLRHLLKAYKSSASGIFCQILFHFLEQLHGPQNMRNLTNVYFGKRTFTYSFPGSAAGAAALKSGRRPRGRSPCPRRRPSVVTEGYIRSPPLPPTHLASKRVHPRVTIIVVIYSVFCV